MNRFHLMAGAAPAVDGTFRFHQGTGKGEGKDKGGV